MTTKDKLKPKIVIEDDPGDIRNCKVVVNCPKKWESLEPLTDVTRHCGTCDEAVFLCKTDAELAEAIRLDRCVAIHPDSEFNDTLGVRFVGKVAPPDYDIE